MLDFELFCTVNDFVTLTHVAPKAIRKELPRVLDVARSLLGRGACPDALVDQTSGVPHLMQWSCLALVTSRGRPGLEPLLELLLTADLKPPVGPNAGSYSRTGELFTPLFCAIRQHRASFVRVLVAHGADVKAPCAEITTTGALDWPVHACLEAACGDLEAHLPITGVVETVDCLLGAGADVDAFEERTIGDEPRDDTALLKALMMLRACAEDATVDSASTAALDAVARRLIDADADVNARDSRQTRPLDFAAALPSLDIFKALIAKGADPTPTPNVIQLPAIGRYISEGQQTGVHYLQIAARDGRADVLLAAAAAGVNLKKVRSLGASAMPLLTLAAVFGQPACVRCLLEYGVDVNEVHEVLEIKRTALDVLLTDREISAGIKAQTVALLRAAGGKRYAEL